MRMYSAGLIASIALSLVSTERLAAGASPQGPTYGTIIGIVSDSTGAPIPNAEVEVAGGTLIGGPLVIMTDDLGKYRIWTLPAGSYTVAARVGGFRERRLTGLELAAGTTVTVDLMLQPGSVEETYSH